MPTRSCRRGARARTCGCRSAIPGVTTAARRLYPTFEDNPDYTSIVNERHHQRLLRLVAPSLWEELEHREAEVRLLGSLFLASVFSGGLAVIEILRELAIVHGVARAAIMWLVASIVLAILIGDGFGHLRRREVEYTYLHTLLAVNAKRRGLLARRENEAE